MSNELRSNLFIQKYTEDIVSKLKLANPDIDEEVVYEKLLYKFANQAVEKEFVIENNYSNKIFNVTSSKLLETFYKHKPILSGYNVLFSPKSKKENVPGKVVSYLISRRKVAKKEMLKYTSDTPHDKMMYRKFDIEQSVIKILANSYYGAFGEKSFHFFNEFLGPSVTYTGQHIISTAILGFEALLASNFIFNTFNELFNYVSNIIGEEIILPKIYKTRLNESKVYKYLVSKCNFKLTEIEENILLNTLVNIDDFRLEKIYFKNNFEEFRNTTKCKKLISAMLCDDYLEPLTVPERLKDESAELLKYAKEFCYYTHQFEDKLNKSKDLLRKVVLLSDTDSTFLYLNPHVQWIQSTFYDNVELNVTQNTNAITIINALVTDFIKHAFYQLTKNYNVEEDDRKLVQMKNEYTLKRIMLTRNKKQYASLITVQEGSIYEKPKLDIKGIQIKKMSTPKIARQFFSEVLDNDIIKAKEIKPIDVLVKYIKFERSIRDKILAGDTSFLKPAKYGKESLYKTPYRIQSVRGVKIWNALFPKQTIVEDSNVNILKLKTFTIEEILEGNMLPDKMLESLAELYDSDADLAGYPFNVIAIPKDSVKFPIEFTNLVDDDIIINDILKNGNVLLESLGFKIIKHSNTHESYSNLIHF